MKSIAAFSVKNPVTVLMLVLAVVLLGAISYSKLGMELLPNVKSPRIFVEVSAGERPPEEIEKQFVDRIEATAIRQRSATGVSSISRVGTAHITVEYAWNTDMDEAFLDLQKALSSVAQSDDLDELNITQHNPNDAPVLLVGLSHVTIDDMNELRKAAQQYIRNELVRVEGVADVQISGHEEQEVIIRTDQYLLQAHGLTTSGIAGRIQNFNRNVAGGSVEEMGMKYVVKGVGVFDDLDDFENCIVGYKQPSATASAAAQPTPILLKDVATVEWRNKRPLNIVRINRQRCIGLAIYKETRHNTIDVVEKVLDAIEQYKISLPQYRFAVIQNQGTFIQQAIGEVKQTALIGILLAVLILYVFLRRIGATLVISLAIPISVVATFNLMYFNGLTVNIMTLGGLVLGAGMLVDNAIVVVENIHRNLETGMDIREASIQGASQVGGAIVASTVTTIVVFLPIVYLQGVAGELFKDQAWTVAFSLLSSLAVALLLVPMLSSRFLRESSGTNHVGSLRFPWYAGFLTKLLDRKRVVIGVALAATVVSLVALPGIGSEFFPHVGGREFSVVVRLPEGTNLQRTSQTADGVETMIRSVLGDAVETVFSQIGPTTTIGSEQSALFEDENTALIQVILRPGPIDADKAIGLLNSSLGTPTNMEMQFRQEQTALQGIVGIGETPLVVEIKGDDLAILEQLTRTAKEKIAALPDVRNLETNFEQGAPEIEVRVDPLRAGLNSIGASEISSQLREKLQGRETGQWEHEGEMKDITIKLPDMGVAQLAQTQVQVGQLLLPLHEVAQVRRTFAPKEIIRTDQVRVGRVTGDCTQKRALDKVIGNVEKTLATLSLPPHYRLSVAGDEQKRRESFRSLFLALLLSVVLVYMVLASQFESLIHPFTIILTVPLSFIGVVATFFILGRPLNVMAFIGIIMLAGIAVNDAIVLVDAIRQLSREGFTLREAVVQAAQRRIRPILMTSLTTILALTPLTFGFGEGAALRAPMALAVIGGLITSTLLTLVVIPCVYEVFEGLRQAFPWGGRRPVDMATRP